jgi:pantoate--beta-alanine ligase
MNIKIIRSVKELVEYRDTLKGKVGLVPTMGALHLGHMSLVDQAVKDNDYVIVSTFVNPTQFGAGEDFDSYPRTEKEDVALLEEHHATAVFIPKASDMYPEGYNSWVEVFDVTQKLEGACRPTHFKGVTTVVNKLFNLTRADNAYFGQKDAQQVAVIKKMVRDLNIHVNIVVMPIVREDSGLARSSRNTYLSADEKKAALILSKTIKLAESEWAKGEKDADVLKAKMIKNLETEPLASVDYVAINHWDDLEEIKTIEAPTLVSMAVRIGATRLIDNTILK